MGSLNVKRLLSARIEAALKDCGVEAPALVRIASRPEYGHYQANGVMAAAKSAQANPRQLAGQVIDRVDADDLIDAVEVAGPGFLNIRLRDQFLADRLNLESPVIGKADRPQTVVVDYSCPNLAKEMHVGHLRSTIIGDAVARILEALGHQVIRQNHVGDWGTQFGMLLAHFGDSDADSETLSDLEAYYRTAKARFDAQPDFQAASRAMVVALQAGEAGARARWQRFIKISLDHCQTLYDRLGASLGPEDVMAESAYNDALPDVLKALGQQGLLTESDGARCVFLPEFRRKDGGITPLIAQKSDGAYLYATTDLAAIRHRAQALGADRALYFTDSRQAFHFKQVFAVARQAGFAGAALSLEHMPFGAMLGKDGKPFKTREGGVVKLTALLDEAEARAMRLVREKNPQLGAEEQAEVARAVGIGAVKYADLSKNRTSDYLFDWEQMLAFEGNTAPYLLYAYARIQSLFRRGDVDPESLGGKAQPSAAAERDLAFVLARLQEVVEQVAEDGYPHALCAYLHDLAATFTRFYEQCPILGAEGGERGNRLRFAQQTARTLRKGLGLLGIATVPRM